MNLPARAAIVGLGLMGGSLARDLAARGVRVRAHDRDPASLRAAREEGVIEAVLPDSLEGVEEAELAVVAVPVTAAVPILQALAERLPATALLTDLGSTKGAIGRAAEALGLGERFVGSHPMTGGHRSGWEASCTGLFQGARVYLCPAPSTGAAALARIRELWRELGALPETMDAAEHDRRLAWSSHLPQVLSSAFARALAAGGLHPGDLGPGGRDVARLAGSSPEMWTAICLDNEPALSAALHAAEAQLAELHAALEAGDAEALHRFFAAGREWINAPPAPVSR